MTQRNNTYIGNWFHTSLQMYTIRNIITVNDLFRTVHLTFAANNCRKVSRLPSARTPNDPASPQVITPDPDAHSFLISFPQASVFVPFRWFCESRATATASFDWSFSRPRIYHRLTASPYPNAEPHSGTESGTRNTLRQRYTEDRSAELQ